MLFYQLGLTRKLKKVVELILWRSYLLCVLVVWVYLSLSL